MHLIIIGLSSGRTIPITVPTGKNSLQYYLCSDAGQLQLLPGTSLVLHTNITHLISGQGFCIVENASNISIMSLVVGTQALISCEQTSSTDKHGARGVAFLYSSHVEISDVEIRHCGSEMDGVVLSSMRDNKLHFTQHAAALFVFSHCQSTQMFNVVISQYHGTAVVLANPSTTVVFSSVIILNSTGEELAVLPQYSNGTYNIGSGMLLYHNTNVFVRVRMSNMAIYNNYNIIQHIECPREKYPVGMETLPSGELYTAAGFTGIFKDIHIMVNISIKNSTFERNWGSFGGGILLLHLNSSNVSTRIDGSNFSANSFITTPGCHGAALASYHVYYSPTGPIATSISDIQIHTALKLTNSAIRDHKGAINGMPTDTKGTYGALYIGKLFHPMVAIQVMIENVHFTHNDAMEAGSCLLAEVINSYLEDNDRHMYVKLHNIVAKLNGQSSSKHLRTEPDGEYHPLFAFDNVHKISISGNNTFQYNSGSVFQTLSSTLFLSGQNDFLNNHADSGPCLRLLGVSYLVLQQGLDASFINNTAYILGGAMYAQTEGRYCVFQFEQQPINLPKLAVAMKFNGNTASDLGASVYASPVYNCTIAGSSNYTNDDIYNEVFSKNTQNSATASISSVPVGINFCADSCINGEGFPVYLGKKYTISVRAYDAANHTVYTPAYITLSGNSNINAMKYYHEFEPTISWILPEKEDQVQEIMASEKCTDLAYTIGANPDSYDECLNTTMGCTLRVFVSLPGDLTTESFKLSIMPCPLGFELQNGTCGCISFFAEIFGKLTCDINTLRIKRPETGNAWMGEVPWDWKNVSGVFGVSVTCPFGFCKSSLFKDTNEFVATDQDKGQFCHNNRNGMLCGNCDTNLSVAFGTDQCLTCTNFYLLTIFMYFAVGIVMIIILFAFRLTLSNGLLVEIVFYANFMNSGVLELMQLYPVPHSKCVQAVIDFLLPVISFLNLNLGFPLCFYRGMTQLAKCYWEFAFPLYLLTIVIVMIVASRHSLRLSTLISHSSTQVLTTVVHLSFARLLLTVIDIFSFTTVFTAEGDMTVWLLNGSISYSNSTHIGLMSFGFVTVSIFLIPYLVLLLGARSWLRIRLINRYLKPFLDSMLASYKDDKEYWFGARMLLLVFTYLVYSGFRGYKLLYIYPVNGCTIIIFSIAHAVAEPFRSRFVNCVDCFLMGNLCMIYMGTVLFASNELHNSRVAQDITTILMCFAFIIFVICMVHHFLHLFGCAEKFEQIRKTRIDLTLSHPSRLHLTTRKSNYQAIFNPEIKDGNSFKESSCCEYREPLLSC